MIPEQRPRPIEKYFYSLSLLCQKAHWLAGTAKCFIQVCIDMLRLGRRSAIFSQLVPRSARSFFCVSRSTFTTTCLLSRRALSTVAELQDNLFEFTSGRWV